MNLKEKDLFEKVLTRHVYNADDRKHYQELMDSYKELTKISKGSEVIVTDEDLNILSEYQNIATLIQGIPEILNKYASAVTVKDAIRDMRCRFEGKIIHYKHNFDNGKITKPVVRVYKKAIPLQNIDGSYTDSISGVTVSKEDLWVMENYKLVIRYDKKKYYSESIARKGGEKITISRLIMKQYTNLTGLVVDHIDGNTKNNIRDNLRACKQNLNNINRKANQPKKYVKSSKYMGVSVNKRGNITMTASVFKQRIDKRKCSSELYAAKLYDVINLCLGGEYANINFDRNTYDKKFLDRFYRLYLRYLKKV